MDLCLQQFYSDFRGITRFKLGLALPVFVILVKIRTQHALKITTRPPVCFDHGICEKHWVPFITTTCGPHNLEFRSNQHRVVTGKPAEHPCGPGSLRIFNQMLGRWLIRLFLTTDLHIVNLESKETYFLASHKSSQNEKGHRRKPAKFPFD